MRSDEVVADVVLMLEELAGDDGAHGVTADILGSTGAAAVAIEPGDRVGAAEFEGAAEDVELIAHPSILLHPQSSGRAGSSHKGRLNRNALRAEDPNVTSATKTARKPAAKKAPANKAPAKKAVAAKKAVTAKKTVAKKAVRVAVPTQRKPAAAKKVPAQRTPVAGKAVVRKPVVKRVVAVVTPAPVVTPEPVVAPAPKVATPKPLVAKELARRKVVLPFRERLEEAMHRELKHDGPVCHACRMNGSRLASLAAMPAPVAV